MSIHVRIKTRRLELGYSQERLAKELGVTRQTIKQWETDPDPSNPKVFSTAPKRTRLAEVARLLGVTEEWLATGRDPVAATAPLRDPIERQLLEFYRSLPTELQEVLVQQANALHNAANPGARSAANPFPDKKPTKG
jgi:transcriptional regulator with XRE-family HTH domain